MSPPKKILKASQVGALWENVRHNHTIWHFVRYKRVATFINAMKGKLVLDIGCGIGLQILLLEDKNVIGFDIAAENLRVAKKIRVPKKSTQCSFVLADLHSLPIDREFDIILCSEVLEHLYDDKKALKALVPLLKENGFLVVTLPNILRFSLSRLIRRNRYMSRNHVREYTYYDAYNLFTSLPLKIDKLTGIYLEFPPFLLLEVLQQTIGVFSINLSVAMCTVLYKIYTTLWRKLESAFWHRSHYILVVLKKAHTYACRNSSNSCNIRKHR